MSFPWDRAVPNSIKNTDCWNYEYKLCTWAFVVSDESCLCSHDEFLWTCGIQRENWLTSPSSSSTPLTGHGRRWGWTFFHLRINQLLKERVISDFYQLCKQIHVPIFSVCFLPCRSMKLGSHPTQAKSSLDLCTHIPHGLHKILSHVNVQSHFFVHFSS